MIILNWLVLLLIPILLGTAVLKLQRVQNAGLAYRYMLGFFVLLLLFAGMVFLCRRADMPFTSLCMLFSCLLVLLCGITCVVCQKDLREALLFRMKRQSGITYLWYAGILLLAVVQLRFLMQNAVGIGKESLAELLRSVQTSEAIPEGSTALQIFYAYLSAIFSIEPEKLLSLCVPIWTLAVSYVVYFLWAAYFFEKKKDRAFYLLCYSALLVGGDTLFTTVSHHFYHAGWTGGTVILGIVIPFLIYVWMQKRYRKSLPFLLSIAAIFTMVPLFKSFGLNSTVPAVADVIWHVNTTVNTYGKYNAFYYAALLFLFVRDGEKDRKLFFYNIAALAVVWNPVVINALLQIFPQLQNYWQFLGILPTLGVIAYAGTLLYNRIEEKVLHYEGNRKRES